MRYKTDTKIELNLGDETKVAYILSSQHRKKRNPHKSIWTISFDEEVKCFIQTIENNWIDDNQAWGIIIIDESLQVLGQNIRREDLKLSKFIDASNSSDWHGYPADYFNNSQDRPTTAILMMWVKLGVLSKSKMIKIRKGQSCNL